CPGLNAVIRAVCRRLWEHGHDTVAVLNGWRGMVETDLKPLGWDEISGILPKGGTIIGTSRTNPYKLDGGVDGVRKTFEQLDALVAIGGEDTLGVAAKLSSEFRLPLVGVPKTIDNDLNGTDYTFGFDTAVQVATHAVDRCHSTAESHSRILLVETMGRHAGWSALSQGIPGGADLIPLPQPAARHPDGTRPDARRPLRPRGGRPRAGGELGPDGGAARRRGRLRAADGGDRRAEARAAVLVRDREDVLRLVVEKLGSPTIVE